MAPLLKISEVAERLNVSEAFVYESVASGRLKHHKLGKGQGGKRISEEQLAEFLRETEVGGQLVSVAAQPRIAVKTLKNLTLDS